MISCPGENTMKHDEEPLHGPYITYIHYISQLDSGNSSARILQTGSFPRCYTAHTAHISSPLLLQSATMETSTLSCWWKEGFAFLLRSALHGAFSQIDCDKEPPQWELSALIKAVYQGSGTANEIARVKAVLQHSAASGRENSSQHFPLRLQAEITRFSHRKSCVKAQDPRSTSHFTLYTISTCSALKWWQSFSCAVNLSPQLSWK